MDYHAKNTNSSTWKGIIRSFNMVKVTFYDERVSLRFDTWLLTEPLCLLVNNIHPIEIIWQVEDIVTDVRWDLPWVRTPLPLTIKALIEFQPLHKSALKDHMVVWKGSTAKVPTARAFFKFLSQ